MWQPHLFPMSLRVQLPDNLKISPFSILLRRISEKQLKVYVTHMTEKLIEFGPLSEVLTPLPQMALRSLCHAALAGPTRVAHWVGWPARWPLRIGERDPVWRSCGLWARPPPHFWNMIIGDHHHWHKKNRVKSTAQLQKPYVKYKNFIFD